MKHVQSADEVTFDGPAVYRIRVRGKIPASWANRLEDMAISVEARGPDRSVTTLSGELGDQASLAGVLNSIYGLRLPVLSVECLNAIVWDQGL
jgi:hypothetical protein